MGCMDIPASVIVPSDDEAKYPSVEGWKKIPRVMRSDVSLYVRVTQDEKLDVKYVSTLYGLFTGIGIKGVGTF